MLTQVFTEPVSQVAPTVKVYRADRQLHSKEQKSILRGILDMSQKWGIFQHY